MARRLVLVAASLALGLAASPAKASNCAIDEYDHNGSLMEMQVCDGGGMTISYVRPRRGLTSVGVVSGTLLFNGVEQAGGVISGQARRFDKTCGPVLYPVTGHNHSGSIILRGNAPKLDGRCQVIGYRADKLLFTLQGAVQPPPAGGPAVVAPRPVRPATSSHRASVWPVGRRRQPRRAGIGMPLAARSSRAARRKAAPANSVPAGW